MFGDWFACAKIETAACCMIWFRVNFAVSLEKSVSVIRLREAERFSALVSRFRTVEPRRF